MLRAAVRISLASPRTGWLLTRMVAWKVTLALVKHALPLSTLVRLVDPGPRKRAIDAEECARVEWAVRRLGRVLAGGDCLERSLVSYRFLARAGASPVLRIGLDRDAVRTEGHAWVTVDDRPVAETAASLAPYVEVAAFTPSGRDGGTAHDPPGADAVAAGAATSDRSSRRSARSRSSLRARLRRAARPKEIRGALERLHERRYGVETSDYVYYEELGLPTQDRLWHIPSDWGGLRRALARLDPTGDDVFVDVGSGLGRAVVVAAQFPFRRVLGVELSQELNERARANVGRAQRTFRCRDVELIAADATEWSLPPDVTVVYFFSPFTEEVFDRVVANLLDSVDEHPRPLRLLYNLPVEHSRLLRTRRTRVIDVCPAKWPAAGDEGEVMVTYQLLPADGPTAEELASRFPSQVPEGSEAWLGEYEPGYLIYKPKRLGGIAVYRPRQDRADSPPAGGAQGAAP